MTEPVIQDSARVLTRAITCGNCARGFRRVHGIHIGSQRLGMIPDTPCQLVFAARATYDSRRPWRAYADGSLLVNKYGMPRRFTTAKSAYTAACEAAPRRWHP